jgi:metal-dependent HD superfamily phosphatase/phosphodiesterase
MARALLPTAVGPTITISEHPAIGDQLSARHLDRWLPDVYHDEATMQAFAAEVLSYQ